MDVVQIILFMLPAYIANSAPVIASGWGPLDFKANFMGKRLLGESKTVRGTLGGLLAGMIVGVLFSLYLPLYMIGPDPANPFTADEKIFVSALMVIGAVIGDLMGSFIKRRLDIEPGEPLFVTDQLLFILMAVIFSWIYKGFFITIYDLGVILILTFVLHILANVLAHRLNLKRVPW